MSRNVRETHIQVKPECAPGAIAPLLYPAHYVRMAKKFRHRLKRRAAGATWRRTNLRAWREHRARSLVSLAEPMGITHGQLSKIERGLHPYNQKILEVAAHELNCTVQDILTRLPTEGSNVFDIWPRLDEQQKKRMNRVAASLIEDSEEMS